MTEQKREARRQQRQEHARQGILEAAKRVFAKTGIESATMQEIAEEAGYSPSSLYNYFPSKEDILRAAFQAIEEAAMEAIGRPQAEGESFRQYVEALMLEQLQLAEKNREFISYFILTKHAAGARSNCISPDHIDREVERLGKILESGMEQGAIRRMDPRIAGHLVNALAHSVFYLHFGLPNSEPPEAMARMFCDFVFEGLGAERPVEAADGRSD
jgi:AcrR family transcriptional regulator